MQSRTQNRNQGAFTIIELLTVMSIIVILIGLLVPALNRVRRYSLDLKQRSEFHSQEAGFDMFRNDNGGSFPESFGQDKDGAEYCGAMKLAEALMGQDLL